MLLLLLFQDFNVDFEEPKVLGDITNQSEEAAIITMDIDANEAGVDAETLEAKRPERLPGVDSAKLRLTYEEYTRKRNLIVFRIRQDEEKHDDSEVQWAGAKQSDVVNWYI